MKIPQPKNYEFLWLVNNQPYFPTSYWITPEYLKRYFLVTIKNKDLKFYVGKKELKRLSRLGLIFFQRYFSSYKKKVNQNLKQTPKLFRIFTSKNIKTLTNDTLKQEFLKLIKYIISLWTFYFYTEYFLHEGIAKKIEKNPSENKSLSRKTQEMQKLKFSLRTILNKTYFFKGNILERFLKEIQKRTKRKNLYNFHYQEIANLLDGIKIEKINRKYLVFGKFNQWQLISGKEALKIINLLDQTLLSKTTGEIKLRGQIANRGFYIGRVKIIPFDLKKDINKDISRMRKGNVLVTGSTGPEMIKACQKAGAIVTEEGEICSHAAIVSREFGIPCIIGTKIATQVLKDEDIVEVDAKAGVVKKISKNEKK